jgi:HK97 gp10 family phage protein
MANTKITFSGGPQLEAALRDLGSKAAGRLGTNAVRSGARVIANAAKATAPVRTGELKKSIRMFDERSQTGGTERTAYAGTRLFYAYWVEFGTAHSPAQSFLRTAADTAWQDAVDKMKENLAQGIERETAKYKGR